MWLVGVEAGVTSVTKCFISTTEGWWDRKQNLPAFGQSSEH